MSKLSLLAAVAATAVFALPAQAFNAPNTGAGDAIDATVGGVSTATRVEVAALARAEAQRLASAGIVQGEGSIERAAPRSAGVANRVQVRAEAAEAARQQIYAHRLVPGGGAVVTFSSAQLQAIKAAGESAVTGQVAAAR